MTSPHGMSDYELYPFRFRRHGDKELLVNDAGEFLFVPAGSVSRIAGRQVQSDEAMYNDLVSGQFIYDRSSVSMMDLLVAKLRTKKSFVGRPPALHIFVLTLRCNQECRYCQVSSKSHDASGCDMDKATIDKSLAAAMELSPTDLTVEIQGGEPLLVFDSVRYLVAEGRRMAQQRGKRAQFVLCTNLLLADDDTLAYCRDEDVLISTSLDGPSVVHSGNRLARNGDSHGLFLERLEKAFSIVGRERVSALTTVTQASLGHGRRIVDEFIRLGLRTLFLRRMTPVGRGRIAEQYSTEQFIDFYVGTLGYIIERNMAGAELADGYSSILLRKILTPFASGYVNLQSPAGMGTSVLVYHYSGDVYAQDEGRMLAEEGDRRFCIGNVHSSKPEAIVADPGLRAMIEESLSESLPGCSDCAYLPYCGIDPVHEYIATGRLVSHRALSQQCRFHLALFDFLFSAIQKDDAAIERLFMSWARGVSSASLEATEAECTR